MNNRYPNVVLVIVILLSGWQSITVTARLDRHNSDLKTSVLESL